MRRVASLLETGRVDGVLARAAERAWTRVVEPRLVKQLVWRDSARVVVVGGATLGGSGKTPLAIACARTLAEAGRRVALVGHAYRAAPRRARVVRPDDRVDEVGDEALVCARAVVGHGAFVVVAPTRQAALDRALEEADIAVVDGVHQTAPRRASLALLAVDPAAPWGSGACPPRGDLRAAQAVLTELADRVVPVRATSRGAWRDGMLLRWADLRSARTGLVTALARPSRVVERLAAHGVHPAVVRTFSDHARVHLRSDPRVDLWLATEKCAASLRSPWPVAVLEHEVVLEPRTVAALHRDVLDPGYAGAIRSKHRDFLYGTFGDHG